ncbi:MAG: MFS transporter [Oleispira sp.]|nr:MFS transporter [Oleispira sp.]MBL4879719.1 MFS transporter [Oleispira sp.]
MKRLTGSNYDLIVVCLSLFIVTFSVNLEVPLYPVYAADNGKANGFIALIFSAYVVGLIPVLVLFGGISDYIGKKNTMLISLFISLISNCLILIDQTYQMLFVVRILQGISVAGMLGASAAFILDNIDDLNKSANIQGVLVSVGLGTGALFTSITIPLTELDLPLSYYFVAVINLLCIVSMLIIPNEKIINYGGIVRLPLMSSNSWVYCFSIFVAWSMVGVIISVAMPIFKSMDAAEYNGLLIFLSISSGAVFQPLCRDRAPLWALKNGWIISILSYLLLVIGIVYTSVILLLIAALLTGISSLGFLYIGGLKSVMNDTTEDTAKAVSGYFIYGYLGLGIPCVFVSFITDIIGVVNAVFLFGLVYFILMIIAYFIYWYQKKHVVVCEYHVAINKSKCVNYTGAKNV